MLSFDHSQKADQLREMVARGRNFHAFISIQRNGGLNMGHTQRFDAP